MPRDNRALEALGAPDPPATGNGRHRPSNGRRRPAKPPTASARDEVRQQVVDYVTANPGSTAGDVAKALGLNRNLVATRLAQLAKAGALEKSARGYSSS
jgi:predicted transcriptional regulator